MFCGSSSGRRPVYADQAVALAGELLRRRIGLVYGGSHVGLMGIVADAMLSGGGEAVGVIPEALMAKEIGHSALTRLEVVDSMHERKARMAELADGFVALPGGFGTLEEFAEAVTWTQLGLQRKPCGLLDVDGYYQPLLGWFDHAVGEGFLKPANRRLVLDCAEPGQLLDRLDGWRPDPVDKWLDPPAGLEA